MSRINTSAAPGSRLQHVLPASAVLALTLTVIWLSYTREPADAFLFPRLISSVMLVLALWNFVRALSGLSRVGEGLSIDTLRSITPGLVVMLVLVYFAAKVLGFYVASWLAFLCLFSLYDPASHLAAGSWVKRVFITTVFMTVIYALFSLVLKVQTPRGHFF